MIVLHKLWRALKVLSAIAFHLAKLILTRPRTRPQRAAWLTGLCRAVLHAVSVTCSTAGHVPMQGAVIANHISYLDILIHAATRPCVFVSAIETRKLPIIGWISMMAGTVYVTRGAGGSAEKAAEGMAKGFRDQLPVVFFPEGTTGIGDEPVMPFRSGLIAQALEAGAPITPGFLTYTLSPIDLARGKSVRNDVAWGPQTLLAHLWNFLGLHAFHAELRFAAPIAFSPAAYEDRKLAAEQARAAVLSIRTPSLTH
ncbi:MAG TPA: lysophospholipid acyltransferase family protein [Acidobacteriaceae bacterium]|nr:lysophospholipid acyltransferase family protein [Acidobacteriaceae bacterium]